MKYKIITLGCKANQYDSAYMSRLLSAAGYAVTDGVADVCIVNSCTVTATADSKSGKALRRARREHPGAVMVLTGCMAQVRTDVAAAFPEADIILGIAEQRSIVSELERYFKKGGRLADIGKNDGEVSSFIEAFPDHSRAFLKIEDGCNNFCAYCIVPYARGRVRSKPLSAVLDEVSALTDGGYNELVLTGINLSAYGADCGSSLERLLGAIGEQGKAKRVRLSSVEPNILTDSFIDRLGGMDFLCPHLHLSLQSGCDATLKRMGRRYDAVFIAAAAAQLRKRLPGVQLTCDVIVGFPGETDEEFLLTERFLGELELLDMHVFQYSRRPGTPAADMDGQVPEEVKHSRSERLLALAAASRERVTAAARRHPLSVLFETERDGVFEGFSREYIPVRAKGDYRCGEVYEVRPESEI